MKQREEGRETQTKRQRERCQSSCHCRKTREGAGCTTARLLEEYLTPSTRMDVTWATQGAEYHLTWAAHLTWATQGAEYQILESIIQSSGKNPNLRGLKQFQRILLECSNIELYHGQKLQVGMQTVSLSLTQVDAPQPALSSSPALPAPFARPHFHGNTCLPTHIRTTCISLDLRAAIAICTGTCQPRCCKHATPVCAYAYAPTCTAPVHAAPLMAWSTSSPFQFDTTDLV